MDFGKPFGRGSTHLASDKAVRIVVIKDLAHETPHIAVGAAHRFGGV
ncbi:MAG TPA: hypothetical protein VKB46_01240 [Pyrinomonadaceae bacterium]|nr:hypothetical protein [Pyrinomonadaceae bacterium]